MAISILSAGPLQSVTIEVLREGGFVPVQKNSVLQIAASSRSFSLRCRAIGAPESLLVWRCATATAKCTALAAQITNHVLFEFINITTFIAKYILH